MKVSKLSLKLREIIAASAIIVMATACNDNTGTANNSTTAPDSSSSTINNNTPSAPATTIKKGRATATIKADDMTAKMEKDKMGYYNRTEMAPAYKGSLDTYINDHIEYPQDAIDNNIEGTVYVQFGIDEKGKVSNVSTIGKKIGYGLEDEAIKVVSNMPDWAPGQVKGKNVKTWRTLPITYKIDS